MSTGPGRLVVDPEDAAARLALLASARTLALDTEGDGMFRYRTRLCTVQLAAGEDAHVFDTLALEPARLLAPLLGPDGPEKLVHDVSFDARVLFAHGIKLANVFDTAIAARFLGLKNTGLSSLLAHFFQIHLPKHKQQADWGARPLDDEALAYLADDVRHLAALARELSAELEAREIADEVEEECRYMLGEAQVESPKQTPFMRVKGALALEPAQRARLFELAEAREAIAQEVDLPPTRLVVNDQLVALSCRPPESPEALEKALSTRATPHAARLWEALVRARERADAPEEDVRRLTPEVPSPAELERRKRRRRVLTDFRAREAELRGIDAQAVLPGHCLSHIVELDTLDVARLAEVPGFGACRLARYGARLVRDFARGW